MTELQRRKKIYNPKSISSLAKYLQVTSATVFGWRRATYRVDGETIENPKSALKFELIMLGWQQKCKDELSE